MKAARIPASRLVGDWQSVLIGEPGQTGFFRITDDFRCFTAIPMQADRSDRIAQNRLWMEPESESSFKLFRADKPFEIHHRYFFEGEVLMLTQFLGDQKLHEWRCIRVTAAELPEYFEPEFAKAMDKPW